MSFQEEEALLEPFMAQAEKGQMLDTAELEKRYEEAVGHRIGSGQIYRVLKRHDWRKVMPRSKHPRKASEEVIETSKKLRVITTKCGLANGLGEREGDCRSGGIWLRSDCQYSENRKPSELPA